MMKFTHKTLLLTTTVFLSTMLTTGAKAQLDIPSSAQVGQSDSSVERPNFDTVTSPQINVPEVRIDNAPDGAENIMLTLNGINLEGVSAYSVAELQQIWADDLGQTISLNDVYGIAQQITRKYRNDGYIITQAIIPQQTIDDGYVTIKVVEGFIDDVILQDADDTIANQRVLNLANNLTQQRPLTASALERWLLIVNDIPGMSARSIISPSETTVGGANLTIIPSIKPFNASMNIDNYGSRYLGPLQASVAGQANNLLGLAETIQLQYVTDPDDDERAYGFLRYAMPINNYGTKIGFDYSHSDTVPGFKLDAFDVNGRSDVFGVDLSHPITRSRTQNLTGSLRFDYRSLRSKNIIDTFTTQDRIASIRAGLDYNVFDNFWKPAVNQASLILSQGIKLFNVSENGDANMTRANGDPQYTKIEAELSRLQTLSQDFSILTSIKGQLSNNPLLSSEEMGFGGRGYGRGYDSSEIVGDDGFGASIELRWNPNHQISYIKDYEIFGFYDFGKVWNQETDVDSLETQSLASTGIGVRTDFTDTIKAEFIYAQPLTKDVDVYENTHGRFKFSLGASF